MKKTFKLTGGTAESRKEDGTISVYCDEGSNDEGDVVVVNTVGMDLRAAVVTKDRMKVVKWLGRTCRRDVSPRRVCMDYLFEEDDKKAMSYVR